MRKFIKAIACVLLATLFLSSCAIFDRNDSGERYDYDLSKYVSFTDPSEIFVAFEDPTVCTQEELENAKEQVLLSYATFEKKEGPVELYNKVVLDYRMYLKGEELEDYTETEYRIVVGSDGHGDMDYAIGMAMIGAQPLQTREVEYTFPKDDPSIGEWAGLTVTLKGTLKEVYQHYLPECNDDFVSNLGSEEYSFSSVEQFYDELRGQILDQKEAARNQAVFNAFMDSVKVKKYPKKELQEYIEKERENTKAAAEQLGISLEQYLSQHLATAPEEFEVQLEENAKVRVRNDMACIQLSRVLGTTVSDEEYQSGLSRLFEEEGGADGTGFATEKEFEAHYTKREIRESLMWEKSFADLVERVKRVDPKQ